MALTSVVCPGPDVILISARPGLVEGSNSSHLHLAGPPARPATTRGDMPRPQLSPQRPGTGRACWTEREAPRALTDDCFLLFCHLSIFHHSFLPFGFHTFSWHLLTLIHTSLSCQLGKVASTTRPTRLSGLGTAVWERETRPFRHQAYVRRS